MRFVTLVLALLLALPSLGFGRPRRRAPRKGKAAKVTKAVKAPKGARGAKGAKGAATKVRGAVKDGGRHRLHGGDADLDRKKGGSRDHDPRLDAPGKESAPVGGGNPALQRGQRLEFDGRLVQGQTARSGAVYLFERARSELRSMVRERRSYRDEIIRTVFEHGGKR
jgi:hypothetical protein